jgi:hypothetical protein
MQESKLMMRRYWIGLALVLSACREKAKPLDVFPETVATVWHRTSLQELPVSEAPDPVPRTSVNRFQRAGYDGAGKLDARVYELTSSAVGLEMVQRWRPSADTIFFNQGQLLVVVKWEKADRQALQSFVRELERRIPK